MIRKILIATDGSDHAKRALLFAIESAVKWNSELIIVSVVPQISHILVPTPGFYIEEYILELEKAYQNVLLEAENEIKNKNSEILTRTHLGKGRPADIIIELAEKENVDLVVIGSRGLGRITGTVLGSTSQAVVHTCTKPILIVR
jgi:nucleotide-binding universal stress UspA family protein